VTRISAALKTEPLVRDLLTLLECFVKLIAPIQEEIELIVIIATEQMNTLRIN